MQIPKICQGSYFLSFLQPRKRSEQALVWVVQQACVCGVSTRRVDQLVESLGLRISKSEVSQIAGLLDEQVQAFRERRNLCGLASRRVLRAHVAMTGPRSWSTCCESWWLVVSAG